MLGLALDAVLIALIVIGIGFRFSWTNWSENTDLHPDEYGLTGTLTQLRMPSSLGEYFNTRISPLSPYQKYDVDGTPLQPSFEHPMPDNSMRWGQWPLTIIRWVAEVTDNADYGNLRLLGRRLSALADTLALGVIFLIGWRLYGRRAGLLAAALSGLAVMQIQQSHFMTADNFGTLFAALAMYAAVRVATGGRQSETNDDRDWSSSSGRRTKDEGRMSPANWWPSVLGRPSSFLWYALFGVFFGMALASRINLAPLAAEIVVAAVIAYAAEWQRGDRDRTSLLSEAALRLVVAGMLAVITFRVTQPMSFRAETGDTTIFTINPNPEWLASMAVAQAESSGEGGGPPGEQWTDRPALIFPFINMVVWGMGLPLGLTAWAGLLWAAWRSFKSDDDVSWKQHALPLTWAGGYFLFMGTRWVKSIRYFLPIYPFLALLAAWAIVSLWQMSRERRGNEGNWGNEGNVVQRGSSFISSLSFSSLLRWAAVVLGAVVLSGTLAWAWGFTSIYRTTNTRVAATRWFYQNVPAPLNLQIQTADGPYTELLPAPDGLTIAEAPYQLRFTARVTGTVTSISVPYAANPFDPASSATLHVVLASDVDGSEPLAEADLVVGPSAPGGDPRGQAVQSELGPVALENGQTYSLVLQAAAGQAVQVRQIAATHENWDEAFPIRMDGRDPFGGLYSGPIMEMHWLDDENKRQMLLTNLATADYVIVQSQRRLWSSQRLPNTYPMTMEYYRALFDGRLGFDLAAQFQSPIVIGPLQVSSEAATLAWGQAPPNPPPGSGYPFNYSPLAAEEAFSVYDHAPLWIFKKRADFNLAQARAILNAVDLETVVNQGPRDATRTPTLFQLPADLLADLRAGGTWREMFNFEGLLNRYEWLGVLAWYATLVVIGWLAFPLAFAAFSGLADRGYPLAKTLALLVATWLVWMAASYRALPFTRGTIALGFLAVAALSGLIYWRRRAEINAFVRTHRQMILVVEGVALALFAFDLLLRYSNPDLWHPNFGGEKPMVFSFFNAVLKSESFPPYNPWLAGYYLNYYYYGFVIVAMLTKLLGIVPAFAYNLILPMLFSMVGMGAFSVAYNLVAARGGEDGGQKSPTGGLRLEVGGAEGGSDDGRPIESLGKPVANGGPEAGLWTLEGRGQADGASGGLETGAAADVQSVTAQAGAQAPRALEASERVEPPAGSARVSGGVLEAQPEADNGEEAEPAFGMTVYDQPAAEPSPKSEPPAIANYQLPITSFHVPAANPYLAGVAAALLVVVLGNLAQIHTFLRGFQNAAGGAAVENSVLGNNDLSRILNGFWRVVTGETSLPVGTGNWYWDATRIVTTLVPENRGEITEFPFFTFLYADLHAHMIDMPFTLLSLGWALSYLLAASAHQRRMGVVGAGRGRRGWLEWGAVWLVGGLALGVPRATNTWDFPLFLALGAIAVVVGEWLRSPRLSRVTLFAIGWRVGLLLGLALAFYLPFDQWFAAAYAELKRFDGNTQPISSFLYIHGLFLFILGSFLIWETVRWLAETPATVLSQAGEWLPMAVLAALVLLAAVGAFWFVLDVPIGLIAIPLMAWAGLLLLRRGEAMPLAKRAVLFLLGTALAVTLFVELYTLEADRMNTIFKFYIQVWVVLSVAGGAALAWLWASLPRWSPGWRTAWTSVLAVLVAGAALYTLTASAAKARDRFPAVAAIPNSGCSPIEGMALPYERGLPPDEQPHSLYGLDYMTWSAYCDRDAFLPLAYDHEAIRWLQDNAAGSPVIVEAQSFDLYKMSSRYAWNTGLPDVVGWDYHTRQHNGAIPTEFVTVRGSEIITFYTTHSPDEALDFLRRYDARYVIVGPMEQAYYAGSGGLAKFADMAARGDLSVAYQNPGVIIYAVAPKAAAAGAALAGAE